MNKWKYEIRKDYTKKYNTPEFTPESERNS